MTITVDDLAQEIRRVDGEHKLGAGALAEALMPFLALRQSSPSDGQPAGDRNEVQLIAQTVAVGPASAMVDKFTKKVFDGYAGHDRIHELVNAIMLTFLKKLGVKPSHKHKKRGEDVVFIGFGKMQTDRWGLFSDEFEPHSFISADMKEVALYRALGDGSLWVRPKEEFEDGRFEELNDDP